MANVPSSSLPFSLSLVWPSLKKKHICKRKRTFLPTPPPPPPLPPPRLLLPGYISNYTRGSARQITDSLSLILFYGLFLGVIREPLAPPPGPPPPTPNALSELAPSERRRILVYKHHIDYARTGIKKKSQKTTATAIKKKTSCANAMKRNSPQLSGRLAARKAT